MDSIFLWPRARSLSVLAPQHVRSPGCGTQSQLLTEAYINYRTCSCCFIIWSNWVYHLQEDAKKFCFCFLGLGPSVARSVLGVWNIKLTSSPRSFCCLAPRCYVILKPMSQAFDEVPGSVCAVHGCHDKSEANFPAEVDFAVLSRAITEKPIRLTWFSDRISWCKRGCKLYASCANPPA